MPFPFTFEQLATLRHDAHVLMERAGDQEGRLEALVTAAEGDLRHAEAAVPSRCLRRPLPALCTIRTQRRGRRGREASPGRRAPTTPSCRSAQGAARRLHPAGEVEPDAVLVVDDYREIREVLARVLVDAGFVVRTAANGLEGLIAAYEMRPAVIVMDVSMPVLDGIEATRLIKAAEATRDARVIAYTGNAALDVPPTSTLFAAVLQKPATPDAVLTTVRQFVAQ